MRRAMVVLVAMGLIVTACGGDGDAVSVTDVWARTTEGPNGAVYLTIEAGSDDVTLTGVAVTTDVAAMAQIHRSAMGSDGSMSMEPAGDVTIPAGESVEFAPGGLHVMLMGLAGPLEVGDSFEVTLSFGSGVEVTGIVEVRDE